MRRRLPVPALALTLLLPSAEGCQGGTVPLGSECPRFARRCDELPGPGGSHDDDGASAPPDADTPIEADAAPGEDAEAPSVPLPNDDAGVLPVIDAGNEENDAGTGVFPPIENGSLEITSVPPEPGEVHLLSDTQIAPWRWCAGSVEAGRNLGGYTPSDGNSLVSLSLGVGPAMIVQRLSSSLVEGQRYALAIDVARSANGPDEVRLELIGTDISCTSSTTLARTGPLRSDTVAGLETFCLTFTARDDHDHLALRAEPLASTAIVYVDNLRFDPNCR